MNFRLVLGIVLIIFTVGIAFRLFVVPVLRPTVQDYEKAKIDVVKKHGIPTSVGEMPGFYINVKKEVKDWSKVVMNLAPLFSLAIAFLALKKRREK